MSDTAKLYTLALGILLSVGMIGFGVFLGYHFADASKMIEKTTDTIYIERTDTIRFASEVDFTHKTEKVVETRYVEVHDTIRIDSIVYIPIEITQKWYHQDSLCDVWISGYEPNLDSLHLCQRHTTEIVREKVIEREIPRFNVEADVRGIFVSDRLVGSIGAEVRYNKPKMTCSVGAAYTTDKKPVFSIGVGYRFDIK